MPRHTTPYDTLLRVRRIEEDRAKAGLAGANLARREAQAHLAASRERYAQAAAAPHGETDVAGFAARAAHATAAARGVDIARTTLEKADTTRAAATDVALQAAMRTQGLERLVRRAHEARSAEMLAADQRTAEESMAGRTAPGRRR